MQNRNTTPDRNLDLADAFPPIGIFVCVAALLICLPIATQPLLILPTVAFLLMGGLTLHLGRQVYRDLTGTCRSA